MPSKAKIEAVFQVGGYVTNESRLYEVAEVSSSDVLLINCQTEYRFRLSLGQLTGFRAVYPACPDTADSL